MWNVLGLVLLVLLWSVQCLQRLCSVLLPPASALLDAVLSHLQARRRRALYRLQEASYRACADSAAVRFVQERSGRYGNLQRYGDVGKTTYGA